MPSNLDRSLDPVPLPRKPGRLSLRLLRHHLPLCAFSLICTYVLYVTRPYQDVLSKISFSTAYPALVLLTATLLIGPWNLLRKRRQPVSSDLRRDFGIWAGLLGIIHAAVGQCVHLRGRPWLYYIYGPTEHHQFPIRHDLFGLANYTGAASTLLLVALFVTSTDYSLRALGTPQWKQLQRWNYAVFPLAAIHSVAYLATEKKQFAFWVVVAASIAIAASLQAAGFLKRRSAMSVNSSLR
jgi:sulfoxide reductase heme-binding subunit YedZ